MSRQPSAAAPAGESALAVGLSYRAGAGVPVLPVVLGAKTILAPAAVGGAMALAVSVVLSFMSGMEVRKRVITNLAIVATAVGVTYVSGLLLTRVFGIAA